jgi:amino acid transporter
MKLYSKLNLWDIFCIASGAMISSGLFVLPSIAYRHIGPSMIVSYFLAGVLLIPSIFSQAELLTAMPKTGGAYFFIDRTFGSFLGVFGGFSHWFSIVFKSAFALIGIGTFLEFFSSRVDYFQIKIIAISFCIIFVIVNLFSIKTSANFQKLLVLFLFVICYVCFIS